MINKILGILLIIIPTIFVVIAWLEGGLIAAGLYVLYLFATAITTIFPYIGWKLLRK